MICWFVGIYIKWRPNVRSDCWSMTKVIFWGGLLLELVQTPHQQKTPRGDCRAVVNLQHVHGNLKKSLSKATYIICVLNWFICICLSQSAHPALFRSFDPLPALPNQSKTVKIPGNASDGDTNVFRKHTESHFQNDLQATNCPPTRSRLRSCQ